MLRVMITVSHQHLAYYTVTGVPVEDYADSHRHLKYGCISKSKLGYTIASAVPMQRVPAGTAFSLVLVS